MSEPKNRGKSLWVTSGYGYKFREPFVVITVPGGEMIQMSIEEARHHAETVLQVAESAVQDAFIMEWVKEVTKTDDRGAAVLLNEYRTWREKRKL